MRSKAHKNPEPLQTRDITQGQLGRKPVEKVGHHDFFNLHNKITINGKSAGEDSSLRNVPTFNFSKITILPNQPFIQPKLTTSTPADKFEKEADSVAERVMLTEDLSLPIKQNFNTSHQTLQRKCAACEADKKEKKGFPLMRKTSRSDGFEASPVLTSQLNQAKGRGAPLPEGTKAFMENSLKSDFSRVRVHTDHQAAEMSHVIQARAFTYGQDIFFNRGEFNPSSIQGRRLLAHELTHTEQQKGLASTEVQRAEYGGIATGAPSDWSTQVAAATNPAAKATLIQTAVGSTVTVVDRTAQSSGDTSPTPAHLLPYTASSPTVNFDDNLNSKTARGGRRPLSQNAGYTFTDRGSNYVVLGNNALNGNNFYSTLFILNHELDHVRQNIAGSRLTGDASELDAWTTSFIREFHRMYVIRDNGSTCFISNYQTFSALIGYYERATPSEQQAATRRIITYFNTTVQPHAAHLKVFRWWIRRTLGNSPNTLAVDLNTQLSLGINASERLADYRQFPCTGITSLTFPANPTPDLPRFPSTGSRP